MTTPEFILELRKHVGNARLWLPGCTALTIRPVGAAPNTTKAGWSRRRLDPAAIEMLCVRRADNGTWTPVTGIVDPEESPASAARRETLEEAGIVTRVDRLISQSVVGPVIYPNGDVSSYIDTAFVLEWQSGDPYPADGENTETRFMRVNELPEMNPRFTTLVAKMLTGSAVADFEE